MTTETVVVESTSSVVTRVSETSTIIAGGIMGPPGLSKSFSESSEVDLTNLQDGSTLIYSTSSGKWQASTLLEKQVINAGFF